jgi:hypothetical protein
LIDERAQRELQDDLQDDLQDKDDDSLTETDDSGIPMSLYSQDSSNNLKESLFMGRTATKDKVDQALELVHAHPFGKVKPIVSQKTRVKAGIEVDEAECEREVKSFLRQLFELNTCFNKRRYTFVSYGCIKQLDNLDRAALYLTAIAVMSKKEQDALYKELINDRRHLYSGYNL